MSEHTYAVDVRLRDVDFMGHVNNAVYATYLEEARERLFSQVVEESLVELDTVLASMTIEYDRPVHVDESVTIDVRIPELGESSVPLEYDLRADGELAATGRTVQVFVDRETGRSTPIPSTVRERLASVVY